ncbi:hypothetical protein HHK36_022375 [Tetracentron sinense]|uniref:MYB-CC type transcription factor LHEQLE-containing domain-containing protein n=1 Tax=Tetracentron sinense TaxID=13715 RepID=A0A834YQR9_TETSI|nr:hypothetical protein HHK36_022375 [Tetracentron sinense]
MYPGIHLLNGRVGDDLQGSFDDTNLSSDACLVLTSDPKPRLRWTAELHERFVDAVTQLVTIGDGDSGKAVLDESEDPSRPHTFLARCVDECMVGSNGIGPSGVGHSHAGHSGAVGTSGAGLIKPSKLMIIFPISFLNCIAEATPKTIMRTMDVKGLTLYHLKSHLQKYRLGRQSYKDFSDNSKDVGIAVSCIAESQGTSSSSSSSSRMMVQDSNDGYQVTKALRVQMEVQRKLLEEMEVQRHLHLRIEAQGKYLQSILEKACKALNEQVVASSGLEAAREELSQLAIKVSNDEMPIDTFKMPSLSEIVVAMEEKSASRIGECSVDNYLKLTGSPISPMGIGSGVAAMKKRARPMFGNGESLSCESNMC